MPITFDCLVMTSLCTLSLGSTATSAFAVLDGVAHYRILPAAERGTCVVESIRLRGLPLDESDGGKWCAWQLDILLQDGARLAVRGVSDRMPMTSNLGCGAFQSYRFRDRNGEVIEYRDERGDPLLPRYSFEDHLLPVPSDPCVMIDGFAANGTFLGHMAILDGVAAATDPETWPKPSVLTLRPDLLIGTGRNAKDDGTPPDEKHEYRYVPLAEEDYDRLLAAGHNYVVVNEEQRGWTVNRPFFYRCKPDFPDDLYRSNYRGMIMFIDEPAIRIRGQRVHPGGNGTFVLRDTFMHPLEATAMLKSRVASYYTESGVPARIEQALQDDGVDLGLMRLREEEIPAWETVYSTAFYQVEAGAAGIVHEGRYGQENKYWNPTFYFGLEENGHPPRLSEQEVLKQYFAYLRGAARAFDADWGISIYGQSDPEYRDHAVDLAYDMGARYIWFWTSDHMHHLPFTEQLRLGTRILERHRHSPRGDLRELRRAATLAIAYPYGYVVPDRGGQWFLAALGQDCLNPQGTLFGDVTTAAMWQGLLAAKRGESFDFSVDHPGLDDLGYDRVLRVGEDGEVTEAPQLVLRPDNDPRIDLSIGEAIELRASVQEVTPALRADEFAIDGDLSEWQGIPWHPLIVFGDGEDGEIIGGVKFGADRDHFTIAVRVEEPAFNPPAEGWAMWQGDSVRIALDPLHVGAAESVRKAWTDWNVAETVDFLCMADPLGFAPFQFEIGLALLDGQRAAVWLHKGAKEQPRGEMTRGKLVVRRDEHSGETVYEAAVAFTDLPLLAPELLPTFRAAVAVYSSDGKGTVRVAKSDRDTFTWARPMERSGVYAWPASTGQPVHRAAVLWTANVVSSGNAAQFLVPYALGGSARLLVDVHLEPRSPLRTESVSARTVVEVGVSRGCVSLNAILHADPGRYRATAAVRDAGGHLLTESTRTLFVY